MSWKREAKFTITCDHPDCENKVVVHQEHIIESYEFAETKGWKIVRTVNFESDSQFCPAHHPKQGGDE